MVDAKFDEIQETLKRSDALLRRLEASSKLLTQHVQTSVFAYRRQDGENS